MGRRIKKGTTGVAAQYVARSKAVRMLQISLKDFRRLCILKGIYPRDPKRKPGNNASATYYHKKDILYLSHEPLLHKFRTFKTFLKKYHKAQSRAEGTKAKAIRGRKPEMILDHLVRERFPTFSDALRDLDDCLNMVHLYAGLPSGISQGHSAARTASCTTLMREFQNYLIQCREMTAPERSGMLKKVFVSIKGYYFEAEIQGEIVRWMMPHKLVQDPKVADVDFRVMMVFLDFYETMLKFVNFKLYHDIGLVYPPAINTDSESRGLGLSHIISNTKLENEDVDQEKEILADAQEFSTLDTDSELPVTTALATRKRLIFKGLKFFLSRETPMEILEFVILALGGEAVLENPESAKPDGITHQIVDRNWPAENREEGREYVQPQWVFDSINESALLPVRPYAPGTTLPPHLSPFVNDESEGYVPKQREVIREWLKQNNGAVIREEAVQETEGLESMESKYLDDLKKEFEGVPFSVAAEDSDNDEIIAEEDDEDVDKHKHALGKTLMSNKHKRLYSKMMYGIEKKNVVNKRLREKRSRIENGEE